MRSKASILVLLIIVLFAHSSLVAAPVKPVVRHRTATAPPPYTLGQSRQYLEDVLPVVEKITGKKLKKVPTIEIESDNRLTNGIPSVRNPGEEAYVRMVGPGLGLPSLIDIYARGMNQAINRMYLAKYHPENNTIRMVPRNFVPRMKSAGIEPKDYPAALKFIIAHELTHAIQIQEIDRDQLGRGRTDVGQQASFSPVIEGHAKLVERMVADELGRGALDLRMSERLRQRIAEMNKFSTDIYVSVGGWIVGEWYLQGVQFMEWQYRRGGLERLWKILANPPKSASVLYTPEKFNPETEQVSPYVDILNGLEERFGESNKKKWDVQNYELDQMTLRGYVQEALPAELKTITSGLDYARSIEARYEGKSVAVQVYIVRDAAARKPIVSFLSGWFGKACAAGLKKPQKSVKILSKSTKSPAKNSVVKTTCPDQPKRAIYTAVGKTVVVAISANGWGIDDKQVSAIADEALTRSESAVGRRD